MSDCTWEVLWRRFAEGHYSLAIRDGELDAVRSIQPAEFSQAWGRVTGEIVSCSTFCERIVYRLVYFDAWRGLLLRAGIQEGDTLLELCPGSNDLLVRAAASLGVTLSYVAVNLDSENNRTFLARVAGLPIAVTLLETDVLTLLEAKLVRARFVLLHHAINDLVELEACRAVGIDVQKSDWKGSLLVRVGAIRQLAASNRLSSLTEQCIARLLTGISRAVDDDGQIVLNHHSFAHEIAAGYPLDNYLGYLEVTRESVRKHSVPVMELVTQRLDPSEWFIGVPLRRENATPRIGGSVAT